MSVEVAQAPGVPAPVGPSSAKPPSLVTTEPGSGIEPDESRCPWWDGALLGGVALVLYLALGQSSLYRDDGLHILQALHDGRYAADRHLLALPLFGAFAAVMDWFGMSAMRAMAVLSAVGSALGLVWTHRAMAVLGLSRSQAVWACGVVATTPALMFFATVVEYHGTFFCFSQLALWAALRFGQRPDAWRAVRFGGALVVAWSMHSSGALLGVCFGALVLAWPGPSLRAEARPLRLASGLVLALVVQLLGTGIALFAIDAVGLYRGALAQRWVDYAASNFGTLMLQFPEVMWREWLVAYLPASIGLLCVLTRRTLRWAWIGVVVGIVVLCGLGSLLLSLDERGAYLLPVTAPMAVLLVRRYTWPLRLVFVVLGLGLGALAVHRHDDRVPVYQQLENGLRQLRAQDPGILMSLSVDEWATVLLERIDIEVWRLFDDAMLPAAAFREHARLFDDLIEARRPPGGQVWISVRTIEMLREGRTETSLLLLDALLTSYQLDPVAAAGFTGYRLVHKAH